ncbi:hypothetical protein [Actinomyces sp. ph3]|uniref:hypothetical protein n=1 Tax=Actinomyces sp. ph3 TaxID=1118058 RepID=UPI0003721078|nr:hypothetical protein [Actinomyces sp. ph3]
MSNVTTPCFFVDTNALSKLAPRYRATKFFRSYAHLPSVVIKEAGNPEDISILKELEKSITPQILQNLIKIMEQVPTRDTRLVDLYGNKGKADPIIVAYALTQDSLEADGLFPLHEVYIVTNDKAVREMGERFSIKVLSSDDFIRQIDENS